MEIPKKYLEKYVNKPCIQLLFITLPILWFWLITMGIKAGIKKLGFLSFQPGVLVGGKAAKVGGGYFGLN